MNLRKTASFVWLLFLIWSAVGIGSLLLQLDAVAVQSWPLNAPLKSFVLFCVRQGDFVFLLLAFLNLLLFSLQHLGFRAAGLACGTVLIVSAAVETMGTLTGFPFGTYYYTAALGPRLGGVLPAAIPMAWWTVVAGFYFLIRDCRPHWNIRTVSLATALGAVCFDWVLEPFAWQVRHYWIWAGDTVPLQNYAAWFALSFILARLLPLHGKHSPGERMVPALTLGLMLLFFVAGRVLHKT